MDKILDKLGIYDFIAVLISGACNTTFSFVSDRMLFQSQFLFPLSIRNSIEYWIISYFVGITFQELGSLIYSFRKGKVLSEVFNGKKRHANVSWKVNAA